MKQRSILVRLNLDDLTRINHAIDVLCEEYSALKDRDQEHAGTYIDELHGTLNKTILAKIRLEKLLKK